MHRCEITGCAFVACRWLRATDAAGEVRDQMYLCEDHYPTVLKGVKSVGYHAMAAELDVKTGTWLAWPTAV